MHTNKTISLTEKILSRLAEHYGTESWNWHTQQTPFQILIGTVLSQRTRDEKTDIAARSLFSKFPTPERLAGASLAEIESLIRSVNYYRTKAKRIKKICETLMTDFAGETPSDIVKLRKLPGVGIKTASCVLVYGFGKPAIPVDTHVHRIFNRMQLIQTKTPEESEKILWDVVPSQHLLKVNELLVKHGQAICGPRKPKCLLCPVVSLCKYGAIQSKQN